MSFQSEFSQKEEIANAVTHGIGVFLSIIGLVLMVVQSALHGDAWHVVSASVFGTTLILLYLASSSFHAAVRLPVKKVLHLLDQVAIYLLIAGTYTPFTLITLRGPWGWSLFGVIWGVAAAGIVARLFFAAGNKTAAALYMAMGWIVIVAIDPLLENLSSGGLAWLFAGGLSYSLGVIFFLWKRLPYYHAIWHLFVLGGSICHFMAVFLHVLP